MMNKVPFNNKYKLLQKVLSSLSIYKIVIRLKSQVLSNKGRRLVVHRHTCNQIVLLVFKAIGTLDRGAHYRSYQCNPKSPPHILFVLTNLQCFDLGTSLSEKLCFTPRQ